MCFRKTFLNVLSIIIRIKFALCTQLWRPKKCRVVMLSSNEDICSYLLHLSNTNIKLKRLKQKGKCEE